MSEEILTRVQDQVGYVSINRPAARNAVYPELLDEAIAAVETFERDEDLRVLVFGGEGSAFCAGADREKFLLKLPGKSAQQIQTDIYRRFMGLARALKLGTKPTIAAVNGPAVGAGCEFAVACDFRVASPRALFWENWIDLGAIPPLGGMFLLPRLIGAERAADMVMRSRKVSAEEALAWGLVSQVASEDSFAVAVHEFAMSLARRSPRALAIAKQGLRRGAEGGLVAEWEFNVQAQSVLLSSADFTTAMAALAGGRVPSVDTRGR
jgi:enoyl-CoA hydratase/carnithine racemase